MTAAEPLAVGDIPGWFSFRQWYEVLAEIAPPGATLVELGVFCGKSLAFIAERTRDKGCKVVGVDNFLGSPEFSTSVGFKEEGSDKRSMWDDLPTGQLAQKCIECLHDSGTLDNVTLIVSDAAKAADLFADESVFAVFVDADHSADSVERDVKAWLPKVMEGGWIAGDDYDTSFPGVRKGLLRVFREEQLPSLPPEGESRTWAIQRAG